MKCPALDALFVGSACIYFLDFILFFSSLGFGFGFRWLTVCYTLFEGAIFHWPMRCIAMRCTSSPDKLSHFICCAVEFVLMAFLVR